MKDKPVKLSLRSLEGCSGWGALGSPLQVGYPTLSQLVNMGKGVGMSVCAIWEVAPGALKRGCGPDRHEQEGKTTFGASKHNFYS